MIVVVTKEKLLEKFPESSSLLEKLKYQDYVIEYTERCDCFNLIYEFSNKCYNKVYIDLEIAQKECVLLIERKKGKKSEYDGALSFKKPCDEIAEIINQKLDEIKIQEMTKETKNQEMKAMLQKLKTDTKLKEINPDIPINQQMSLEEYKEQVFLWMILKENYTIPVATERMQTYWEDFSEFFEKNYGVGTTVLGILMHLL